MDHGAVRISDHTLTELNRLIKTDSKENNQITEIITLNDAISIANDFGGLLNVDVKDDQCIVPMTKAVKEANVEASCCGINIEFKSPIDELVKTARRRFLPISIRTLTESENPDDYLKLGLYSITTTAVSLLVEKRKRHTEKMALPGVLPEKI